jgi:ribosomal protein L11 methyltransferase
LADSPALDLRWRAGPDANDLADSLSAALDDFGPVAVHEHESGAGWRVFFPSGRQRDDAAASLGARFAGVLVAIQPIDVPDEQWARRSQASLTAIRIGSIVVAPPWDERARGASPRRSAQRRRSRGAHAPLSSGGRALGASSPREPHDELVVIIDPSTGFGTGHHETTRLCLSLLQEIPVAGLRAIDVGTGSGVLAIAAAKLGAAGVLAIDDDPEALRNAEENVLRNGVASAVALRTADLASFQSEPAPVVTANLTAAVLARCAVRLRALVSAGGALIVSGFSPGEADDVARAVAGHVLRCATEGEWAALLLRPTDSPAQS